MHQCGILDEFGNKLCYPEGYKCPINYLTLNSSDKNYTYKEYTIDGVKVYYTNEAIEDGMVLGGFYVDSDLMIKYNIVECQIIDTGKISELLNSQKNKLYRNSLNFDPYKDENIDTKGNAYLKWCIPGVGKERNLTLVKKLDEDYELNKTINKNITDKTKSIKIIYFVSLPGYIIITVALTLIVIIISTKKLIGLYLVSVSFTIFWNFLVLLSSVGSFTINSELSDMNKSNLNKNIFNLIININVAVFLISISLSVIFVIFFCYLSCLKEKIFIDNPSNNDNNYKHLEEKSDIELEKKNDNDSERKNYTPYDSSYPSKSFPSTSEGMN